MHVWLLERGPESETIGVFATRQAACDHAQSLDRYETLEWESDWHGCFVTTDGEYHVREFTVDLGHEPLRAAIEYVTHALENVSVIEIPARETRLVDHGHMRVIAFPASVLTNHLKAFFG